MYCKHVLTFVLCASKLQSNEAYCSKNMQHDAQRECTLSHMTYVNIVQHIIYYHMPTGQAAPGPAGPGVRPGPQG